MKSVSLKERYKKNGILFNVYLSNFAVIIKKCSYSSYILNLYIFPLQNYPPMEMYWVRVQTVFSKIQKNCENQCLFYMPYHHVIKKNNRFHLNLVSHDKIKLVRCFKYLTYHQNWTHFLTHFYKSEIY